MARLTWDETGERLYETGTKNGVLYVKEDGVGKNVWYEPGVPWNGLTAVSESPSGAEESPLYADDIKYLSLRSNEEFGATVEAYTYPDKWAACDGSAALADGVYIGQQVRKGFSLSYVTVVGNDVQGNDFGEKIHIIYNAMASPSEKSYATINDSPEAITFSWELTTVPIAMPDIDGKSTKPSATLIIDSTKLPAAKRDSIMASIKDLLYGTDAVYTRVTSTITGNPKTLGYYELDEGEYVATEDTTATENKDYYSKSGEDSDPTLPHPQDIIDIIEAA